MSRPDFTIGKLHRTNGGALPTSHIQNVRKKLMGGGFVLLPSDTCYSLSALAMDEGSRRAVNAILERKDEPISLAFSSYSAVETLIQTDGTTAVLLEGFTPGPITVVCKAKEDVSEEFLRKAIASSDRTIGVRIPDSWIERDVAACTQFPLMSVAVRDQETGEAIQDFERACELVGSRMERLGQWGWGAIEGDGFYASHSTVVRVGGSFRVSLIRRGDIPFEEILALANRSAASRPAMEGSE